VIAATSGIILNRQEDRMKLRALNQCLLFLLAPSGLLNAVTVFAESISAADCDSVLKSTGQNIESSRESTSAVSKLKSMLNDNTLSTESKRQAVSASATVFGFGSGSASVDNSSVSALQKIFSSDTSSSNIDATERMALSRIGFQPAVDAWQHCIDLVGKNIGYQVTLRGSDGRLGFVTTVADISSTPRQLTGAVPNGNLVCDVHTPNGTAFQTLQPSLFPITLAPQATTFRCTRSPSAAPGTPSKQSDGPADLLITTNDPLIVLQPSLLGFDDVANQAALLASLHKLVSDLNAQVSALNAKLLAQPTQDQIDTLANIDTFATRDCVNEIPGNRMGSGLVFGPNAGEHPYGSYEHTFGGRVLAAWTEAIDNIIKAAQHDPFKVVSITAGTVVWDYTPWNVSDELRLMPCVYRLR
jgi:hypothetical protein